MHAHLLEHVGGVDHLPLIKQEEVSELLEENLWPSSQL